MLSLASSYTAFGFAPGAAAAVLPARRVMIAAASHPAMSATGTETLDFTGGALRNNKDLTDTDLTRMGRRARPNIDWSNLRARLEVEFGFKEEELKQ